MAQKINEIPSLNLAFLGDSVYELFFREKAVLESDSNVNSLNKKTKEFSKAVTQAKIADILTGKDGEEGFLTEEEQGVFRRGRNAKGVSIPGSCTPSEYRKATGLEALVGYLFLMDRKERIAEILNYGIERYNDAK
ncbi:MAG: ribonuclease III [Lachnospiraceae bacterium]|nr:ribonuclease III [Lachnospiraceae bacterium]